METVRVEENSNNKKPQAAAEKSGKPSLWSGILETFRRATTKVDTSIPYVSRSAEEPLNEQNHAFYIGQLIRQNVRDRIRGTITDSQERLYDDDFLNAALEYLVKTVPEGEKAQIVVGPQLGEIFNRPNSTVMGAEEEKAYILKLAKKIGPAAGEKIEVKSFDDIPEYKELLDALRRQKNSESNEVYLDMALHADHPIDFESGPEPRVTPLKIAQCLYKGATEDQIFMNKMAKGIPGKLEKMAEGEEAPKYGYSLTEIAIRLYEIIKGTNYIHGGASRQAVYDYVIMGLIEHADKHRAPSLQPLIKLLKGKKFETMHLKTDQHPQRKISRKKRARRQILSAAMLGAAVAATPAVAKNRYEAYKEAQAEKEIDAVVKQKIRTMRMGFDQFSSPMEPEALKNRLEDHILEIEIRYGISKDDQVILNFPALLLQFMIDHKELLDFPAYADEKNNALLVDLFIRENTILLKSKGINIERPYSNLWEYKDLMLKTAEGQVEEISKDTEAMGSMCERSQDKCLCPKLTEIGKFRSHGFQYSSISSEYVFYILEDCDKRHLIARKYVEIYGPSYVNDKGPIEKIKTYMWYREYYKKYMTATTGLARKAAQEWITEMKRYDASVLYPYRHRLATVSSIYDEMVDEKINHDYTPSEGPYMYREDKYEIEYETYTDSFGSFAYEITPRICYTYRDFEDGSLHDEECVYARRPGEKTFTLLTAVDAVEQYYRADNNDFWWKKDNPYYGH